MHAFVHASAFQMALESLLSSYFALFSNYCDWEYVVLLCVRISFYSCVCESYSNQRDVHSWFFYLVLFVSVKSKHVGNEKKGIKKMRGSIQSIYRKTGTDWKSNLLYAKIWKGWMNLYFL